MKRSAPSRYGRALVAALLTGICGAPFARADNDDADAERAGAQKSAGQAASESAQAASESAQAASESAQAASESAQPASPPGQKASKAAQPASASAFGATERAQLAQGELVERRVTQRRGPLYLMGGNSWQVIDAPPDVVWRALLDTAHYDRMLPQVIEAKLVGQRGDRRKLFLRQGNSIVHTSYYLNLQVDHQRRDISFRTDDSKDNGIRAAWGFYTASPYGEDQTLLTYGIMADIGDGFVGAVVRPTVHEWMMKVPWLIKRFVEGAGRELYQSARAATAGQATPADAGASDVLARSDAHAR